MQEEVLAKDSRSPESCRAHVVPTLTSHYNINFHQFITKQKILVLLTQKLIQKITMWQKKKKILVKRLRSR